MKKKVDNPKISVIIPVYNPGYHLNKCLDSIVGQTYKNLEIIIVDDGSSDGSEKVCDEYKKRDSRIKVIHQKNAGVSRARNVGIDLATGDYYHFPDSDDYLELDTYEYCLNLINRHNCDAIVFEHYITYDKYEKQHISPKEYYGLYEGKNEIIKIYFRIAYTCNKLFSKELIVESTNFSKLRFRDDIFRGEDGIFSREALFRANRVWFTEKALYHYVQSEQSACRGVFRPSQLSLLKAIDITKEFFSEYFPEYISKIESSELESCISLYSNMYLDENDYSQECRDIYERFIKLYNKVDKSLLSKKQVIKSLVFRCNPKFYCWLHQININRLEK